MSVVAVSFDPDIVDSAGIDRPNWSVRWNNVDRAVSTAVIIGSQVRLSIVAAGADPGIDRVSFDPPPFDVLTTDGGNPVQPFTDFPLVM